MTTIAFKGRCNNCGEYGHKKVQCSELKPNDVCPRQSLAPTVSDSVVLVVLSFWAVERAYSAPLPIEMTFPVCDLKEESTEPPTINLGGNVRKVILESNIAA